MASVVDDFRQYLVHTKKATQNTVDSYLRDVNQYIAFCSSAGVSPEEADSKLVYRYLDFLTMRAKSDATKSRMIASVRCFYRYLISVGLAAGDPADGVKMKSA